VREEMETLPSQDFEILIEREIKNLLEEKRVALSVMRTGIGIYIMQILTSGFLIATSKSYRFLEIIHIAVPFYLINAFLLILATYLVISSLIHIRQYDRALFGLKQKNRRISNLLE
jgi:hypothetical protein